MAFKLTCVALVLYVTILLVQGKHVKHGKSKSQKEGGNVTFHSSLCFLCKQN